MMNGADPHLLVGEVVSSSVSNGRSVDPVSSKLSLCSPATSPPPNSVQDVLRIQAGELQPLKRMTDEALAEIPVSPHHRHDTYRPEQAGDAIEEDIKVQTAVSQRGESPPFSSSRTGLCYDVRMRFHATPAEDDAHPEDPRRIYAIYETLCQAGLVDRFHTVAAQSKGDGKYLSRINAREATMEEILLVHTYAHYEFIRKTAVLPIEMLQALTVDGDSVYYNSTTFFCSRLSVGGAIETCKSVTSGHVKNAIALIRPPGHHAVPHEAQGFCIFNNVCVAARACQESFPNTCRKILIFDWDVHHGNGTQDAFYDDPDILYMSIHVHENGTFYPAGDKGDHKHCGEGGGLGKNVNVPWTRKGMTDGDYMYAFQRVIMPIACEFNPDLVIVSAGFDAALGDELGGCFVTPACYAHMTHALMSLAKGKVAVCLEGGYNLESISRSALAVTRTLMGEPPDRLDVDPVSEIAAEDVQKVMQRQSRYWACMRGADIELASTEMNGERMHDIIRQYQAYELYRNHAMINLVMSRERISRSFENQVLATQNYARAQTLLVIFHDPPDLRGISDSKTNKLGLHKTWLTDPLKYYVKWAVEAGYGVIDINVPKFLTDLDEEHEALDSEDPPSIRMTKELVVYLWENYLEINSCRRLFLVGVGDAHYGVVHLINTCDCLSMLQGVVNVVSDAALRSVRRDTDSYIAEWYKANSLVFVNNEHSVFDPGRKALKKKFGRVMRSPKDGLTEMLVDHYSAITEWVEQRNEEAAPSVE